VFYVHVTVNGWYPDMRYPREVGPEVQPVESESDEKTVRE
jgi:hypothetical protein